MRAHLAYMRYVLRHKWFVFVECCKLGVPLRGVVHDLSKFSSGEWSAYVHSFYNTDGSPRQVRDETGYYDPTSVSAQFDAAWLHHQHWNPHHWQYWILVQDEDEDRVLPMPDEYCREMLADWRGAGRAMGKFDTKGWYVKHRDKMQLHPMTREWIEGELGIQSGVGRSSMEVGE